MAHLSIDKNGRAQIQFRHPSGKRYTLRLGKVAKRLGESVLFRVREIIAAVRTGQSVSAETAAWLGTVTPQLHDRLVRVGLAEPRVDVCPTDIAIDDFVRDYIEGRAKLRPNTVRNLKQSHRILTEHFGLTRRLREIGPGDADNFREAMIAKYSSVTAAREVKRASKTVLQGGHATGPHQQQPVFRCEGRVASQRCPKFLCDA